MGTRDQIVFAVTVSLVAAVTMLLAGAYIYFRSGETLGIVFMALSAVFFAQSTMYSVKAKKKDETDAG